MSTQKLNLLPTALEIDPLYVFPASNEGKTYRVSVELVSSWICSKDIKIQNSNYNITRNDKKSTVTFTNSGSSILLIPHNNNEEIPVGTVIDVSNYNITGSVKIVGDTNVSVNSALGVYVKNFGIASLTKIDTNSWILSGNLSSYQDPYFEQTKLLLRMTGDNNSTTFLDNSLSPKIITSNNGTKTVTSNSKFNDSSAEFNNSSLSIPASPDFNFGSEDFTIEFWVYLNNHGGNGHSSLFSISDQSSFGFNSSNTGYYLIIDGMQIITSTTPPDLNTWTHVVLSRYGQRLFIFTNGILTGETIISSSSTYGYSSSVSIGTAVNSTYYLDGNMNDLRVTKGKARYTTNFTPPSEHLYKEQNIITNPNSCPGLQLWLDASDPNTLRDDTESLSPTDTPVSQWIDKSNNNYIITQSQMSQAPIRKVGIVNNKDALLFDGIDDYMDINSIFISQRITMFIVWKPTATEGFFNNPGFAFDSVSSQDGILNRISFLNFQGPYLYASADLRNTSNQLVNNWTVCSLVVDKTSSKIYVNSVLSASGDAGSNNMSSLRIGSRYSLTDYLNGYIGEILLYDSGITDAERIAIEGGLKLKWGISS